MNPLIMHGTSNHIAKFLDPNEALDFARVHSQTNHGVDQVYWKNECEREDYYDKPAGMDWKSHYLAQSTAKLKFLGGNTCIKVANVVIPALCVAAQALIYHTVFEAMRQDGNAAVMMFALAALTEMTWNSHPLFSSLLPFVGGVGQQLVKGPILRSSYRHFLVDTVPLVPLMMYIGIFGFMHAQLHWADHYVEQGINRPEIQSMISAVGGNITHKASKALACLNRCKKETL